MIVRYPVLPSLGVLLLTSFLRLNLGRGSRVVGDIAVHRVPLRFRQPNEPYCYAVSTPSYLIPGVTNFLATQVWPSARVAAQSLLNHMNPSWTMTEFGCGPGLPALAAASLGSPKVYATDLDPFALQLVQLAAHEQHWESRVETRVYDLTANDPPPPSDLYVLSDVFESSLVAKGSAEIVHYILEQQPESRVWVFAQTDRSQRDDFLFRLRELCNDHRLAWTDYVTPPPSSPLWLCSIDETAVNYG